MWKYLINNNRRWLSLIKLRSYTTTTKSSKNHELKNLTNDQKRNMEVPTTPRVSIMTRVKDVSKTGSYLAVILVGVAVTGGLFYTVFRELFLSTSPQNVYKQAVNKCLTDHSLTDKLGEPVSSGGRGRGRRGGQHNFSHAYYFDTAGKRHLRMTFKLTGTAHSGTAHLDMVENNTTNLLEYRFLFVEINDMFKSVIIVEDNRAEIMI